MVNIFWSYARVYVFVKTSAFVIPWSQWNKNLQLSINSSSKFKKITYFVSFFVRDPPDRMQDTSIHTSKSQAPMQLIPRLPFICNFESRQAMDQRNLPNILLLGNINDHINYTQNCALFVCRRQSELFEKEIPK